MNILTIKSKAVEIIASADSARDSKAWPLAADLYKEALSIEPERADIWVQYGHALKESGQLEYATESYRKAIEIDPISSDAHLQLGHALKLQKQPDQATECYRRALDLDRTNVNAARELGMPIVERPSPVRASEGDVSDMLFFDISDLVFYIGHHNNLTGIQRVQCLVIKAILETPSVDRPEIGFVSYDRTSGTYRCIDPTLFAALIEDLALPEERRVIRFDQDSAKEGRLFPIGPFPDPSHNPVAMILLGAAWVIPDYANIIANLKRETGMRFLMTFHDFIPIYARETCDQGTANVFRVFMDQVVPLVDVALCVSENTQRDLKRYCGDFELDLPPSIVTQNGSSFEEFLAVPPPATAEQLISVPERFVLFVSTIEGRKNHDYVLQIWKRLMDWGVKVPKLVCVGRLGWRSENFFQALLSSNYLSGHVQLLENVSDAELKLLYEKCEFSIYPSLYEGWGLPVGECLSYGKVCVISDSTSLPEVAGELGVYIPLNDVSSAAETIRPLIEDKRALRRLEKNVKSNFQPISWTTVGERIINAYRDSRTEEVRGVVPLIRFGEEYSFRSVQSPSSDLLGDEMRVELERANRNNIMKGYTSTIGRRDGLVMRDRRWYAPEDWGCWSKGLKCGLNCAFAFEGLNEDGDLAFYASVDIPNGIEYCAALLSVANQRMGENIALAGGPPLLWAVPIKVLKANSQEIRGVFRVKLELELRVQRDLEASQGIERRSLGIGLKSIAFLPCEDHAARLDVLEQFILRTGFKMPN